jgi:stage II sporulation protein AA (anti-sigma F factor antagonist)
VIDCEKGEMNMEDFQIIDNCLMVRLPEEVDHHQATYICQNADKYILQEDVQNVVFDFENTRFMDSSGIGIIMGRYRKITCFGGRVYAIHADRQIQRILSMSGLAKVVEVLT